VGSRQVDAARLRSNCAGVGDYGSGLGVPGPRQHENELCKHAETVPSHGTPTRFEKTKSNRFELLPSYPLRSLNLGEGGIRLGSVVRGRPRAD
jgi:hypothetical protein